MNHRLALIVCCATALAAATFDLGAQPATLATRLQDATRATAAGDHASAIRIVDSLRYKPNLYQAVGRQTKTFWVAVLVVAFLIAVVSFWNVLFLLNVVGVIAAAVYMADVRPKLKQVSGRGGGSGYGMY